MLHKMKALFPRFDIPVKHARLDKEFEGGKHEGPTRFFVETVSFCMKELRACVLVGLFFIAMILLPRHGLLGIPRYDALLIVAIVIQGWMLWTKLETLDELRAITLFHIVGFVLRRSRLQVASRLGVTRISPNPNC